MRALYVILCLLLLSIINFSPTRYFEYSTIALAVASIGILYNLKNNRHNILITLILLFCITAYSWYHRSFNLHDLAVNGSDIQLLTSASIWLISYSTMHLALKNKFLIRTNALKYFFYLFFCIGALFLVLSLKTASMDEGSNDVYYVLPVLPFIVHFSKKKLLVIGAVFALLILTVKRSAVVIMVLSALWILYCSSRKIIDLKTNTLKVIGAGVLLFVAIYFFAGDYIEAIVARIVGIKEDGGSSRDLIFEYAIGLITGAETRNLLTGFGPRYFWFMSSNISSAHNDFLEISVSCGLIGLSLFIILHYQLIKLLYKVTKNNMEIALPLGLCYITFLTWNLVGCQFAYQSTTVCTCMFWAFAESKLKEYENSLFSKQC